MTQPADRPLPLAPGLVQELGWAGAALVSALLEKATIWGEGEITAQDLAERLAKVLTAEKVQEQLRRLDAMDVLKIEQGPDVWRFRIAPDWLQMVPASRQVEDDLVQGQRPARRAVPMRCDWQPAESSLRQLAQVGVPREFADEELVKFRQFWVDRGGAYKDFNARFVRSVVHSWRRQRVAEERRPLPANWQPSPATTEQLRAEGLDDETLESIHKDFVRAHAFGFRRELDWNGAYFDFALLEQASRGQVLPPDFAVGGAVAATLGVSKARLRDLASGFVEAYGGGQSRSRDWQMSFLAWARYELKRTSEGTP